MDNASRTILIVGNSIDVNDFRSKLDEATFEVVSRLTGAEAKEFLHNNGLPHLLIVDLNLPDMDGITLCEDLYDLAGLPIITVSKDRAPELALQALQVADDFVTDCITTDELVMRARRILSRIHDFRYASGPKMHIYDWLVLDPIQREVTVQGDTRRLTPIENALLHVLIKHRGDVVDADTLIERVWRADPTVSDRNVLRVHIHRLRQKLETDSDLPRVILTERGIGYSFADLEAMS